MNRLPVTAATALVLSVSAAAQITLTPLGTVNLDSTSTAANAEFIGSNPSAIAWNGTDLYAAGFNQSGGTENVAIVQVSNALTAPTFGTAFGVQSAPNLRGYSGLDIDAASVAAAYDNGGNDPNGIAAYDLAGTQLWGKTGRGGSGVGFDPGFPGGSAALGQGVGWATFGSGRRRLQNGTTGADIWDGTNGMVIFTAAGTFFRDMDYDDATGDIWLREGNNVIHGVRSGDNSLSSLSIPFDPADEDFIAVQNLAYVGLPSQEAIFFNDRASTAGGQAFADVVKAIDASGAELTVDWCGFTAPDGVGAYDFSYDAASSTLAICDFTSRDVYVFAVSETQNLDFDTNVGAALGITGDDSTTPVTLGFNFPFPDGTATNSIDIDSNGRIFPAAADTSDFTSTPAELVGQTTSIAALWTDLTPTGTGAGDVFFRTDATIAVITFQDVTEFGGSDEFTFQIQLYPDGRVVLCYDNRVPTTLDSLVGLSEGGGAADPGSSDLTATAGTNGVTTVYEDFTSGMDLIDGCISFTPAGAGWCLANDFPPPPVDGTATTLAQPVQTSLLFSPDGGGGYIVAKVPATFVDDSSLSPVELGTGLGDDALTATQALGHSFQGPGGGTWSSVRMDNNGVVHDGGGTETAGDFNPSVGDLTSDDSKIAAFWTDLSSQNGSLRFATTSTQTVITWENVPQFAETNSLTFQAVLNDDNSFQLNYRDVSQWTTGSGFTSDDVLIGCSEGGGAADPGESDYADYPIVTAGNATNYEFWDASGFTFGILDDLPHIQPRLISTATPQLGGSIELGITGLSTVGFGHTLLIGFSNPNIPLDAIGIPGGVLSAANDVPTPLAPVESTFSLPVPNDPGFVGTLTVFFQAAQFATETPLGIVLTEGVQIAF